jgi:hypothetical protein
MMRLDMRRPGTDVLPHHRDAHETAPPADLAVIYECQRILVQGGGASLTLAVSWCVTEDDALEHKTPTQWLASGGSPETLLRIARQDAARLAR